MKFMMIYEADRNAPRPSPETLLKLQQHTQRMIDSGTVVLTGGLVRPSRGVKLKCEGGQVSVTDGPYAESKELIDGFAIVNAPDLRAAIAMSTEFMQLAGDGKGEILQLIESHDLPQDRCAV